MTNALRQFADLMEKVESLKRKADRAQGAYEQLTKQLKEQFGVSSIEKGERLLKEMEDELETLKKGLEEDMQAFQEKWKDKLER